MIQSAALLIRERGVQATAFADVLEHSGAPRGSIYYHFPDGKSQLVNEATRFAGDFIAAGLTAALAEHDPAGALEVFAAGWRAVLTDSDFDAGCPVVAAALEGERHPAARELAGDAFATWIDMFAEALATHGVAPDRAASVATLGVAAIEGAIVLARAQRSLAPFERVAGELEALVHLTLADVKAA